MRFAALWLRFFVKRLHRIANSCAADELPCIQRAYSVDVRTGVAAIRLRVTVIQGDVVEGHALRNFSCEIDSCGTSFSSADTVPVTEIAADGNFCFFDVRADLKYIKIITWAIIEGKPQA